MLLGSACRVHCNPAAETVRQQQGYKSVCAVGNIEKRVALSTLAETCVTEHNSKLEIAAIHSLELPRNYRSFPRISRFALGCLLGFY